MLNTKQKGLIAEHKLKEFFLLEGYDILSTEGDYLPFDFVIHKNNTYKRVQAKYISLSSNGVIEISFNEIINKNKTIHKGIQADLIDILGIYCPDTNKCYFLNTTDMNKVNTSLCLRVSETKNNQVKNIKWASDYETLEKSNTVVKSCPYCTEYKSLNWHSIRSHVASCSKNTKIYYIDLGIGPLTFTDIQDINSQEELINKFPKVQGHFSNIKRALNNKLRV